jgi:hypothetical protein
MHIDWGGLWTQLVAGILLAAILGLAGWLWSKRASIGEWGSKRPWELAFYAALSTGLLTILVTIAVFLSLAGTVPSPPSPVATEKWRAFYAGLDADGNPDPEIAREELELAFDTSNHAVSGFSIGSSGTHVTKWELVGFFTTDHLTMVETAKEIDGKPERNPGGVSTYYLQRGSAEFTGTIIYKDCAVHAVLKCPVAMTSNLATANTKDARSRWPALFGQICKKEPLDPDENRRLACAAG